MKKKLLKIFAIIFCATLFLTGCATVSDVKDINGDNIYFAEPVYFQGQVAKVGDYLYYGNGYGDITADAFNYTNEKAYSYLARVNTSELTFCEDVLDKNYKNTTPKDVEVVNGDKVVGYLNQDMYVFGEYLYFTSANEHKTNTMLNDFTRISLFRVKFNGDGLEELGTFTYSETSILTLQQGSDGKYYFVIVCPTEVEEVKEQESEASITYDIYSIQVGDSCSKAEKLVGGVNSAVVADEFSEVKNVVYTFGTESERLPNAVSAVDFATGDITSYDSAKESAVTLVGREGDIVLYSYANEIYYKNVANAGIFSATDNARFYSAPTITNVEKMGNGYIFVGTSSLMYKSSLTATAEKIASTSDYSDILFVDGDYVYLSNDSSIMKVSVYDKEIEKIVEGMTIISGECGYADNNIYFYAQLGSLIDEDGNVVESEEEKDLTYYMYQTDKMGNIQLLGKAK